MIIDEVRETSSNERPFRIVEIDEDGKPVNNLVLYAARWTTMESAWASQKCWFPLKCRVRITDENGNSKIFERNE